MNIVQWLSLWLKKKRRKLCKSLGTYLKSSSWHVASCPPTWQCEAYTSAHERLQRFAVLVSQLYSTDLAPSDSHLFPKLKEHLRGYHFLSEDEVKTLVTKNCSSIVSDGLIKAPELRRKCADGLCWEAIECVVMKRAHVTFGAVEKTRNLCADIKQLDGLAD
jgi:hypothetical protein